MIFQDLSNDMLTLKIGRTVTENYTFCCSYLAIFRVFQVLPENYCEFPEKAEHMLASIFQ